ncbi:hypothetical protein IFT37_25190 [Pseudomonas fluorescens]|uniref:hypothetical protein n=1 Tax=Pseudomonas fluorescens group TaxID=136843 RepID=UPI0015E720C4|nr:MULTISPECIES: hypothetical protein [Pseudomonas fluorescens group]MBD8151281.1 hypothetical protein [Pseudomonas fluorescens]MBD8179898.1 hypothetical protein [Pseudomonas fluorescens]MBD8748411.1 hypothetical protein [Pseudomonas fluorescens]MBD8753261.1 hypothetical protein [Pseudomonas fluorescens]MBD8762686.1 hypothetical protein [Pseudomonas fluorescens]
MEVRMHQVGQCNCTGEWNEQGIQLGWNSLQGQLNAVACHWLKTVCGKDAASVNA